jgi:hypothetical protein
MQNGQVQKDLFVSVPKSPTSSQTLLGIALVAGRI